MVGRPTATLEPVVSSSPPIDPRIRARRVEVRRVEGRRRLQRLIEAGLLGLVASAFLAALWTPLLDVDEVRVEGAAHTGVEVVREHAGIGLGDRLATVDLHAAGVRVAALPWVGDVTLHRGVDGVVAISVTERAAVAVVGTGRGAMLVDRSGRVLGPVASTPDLGPVIELTGVEAVPAVGSFLDRAQSDALLVIQRIGTATPGAVGSVAAEGLTASLVQGGEVRFGDTSQLDAKVRSLRTVLDQVDLRCLAVLDLRLPGSPVLTREEGCS